MTLDIEDLEHAWFQIYDDFARDSLPEAVLDACNDALEDFTHDHPYTDRTHHLTDDAWARIARVSDNGTFAEIRWPAKYASFVDKGTRAHEIRPKKARALHWIDGGGEDRFATVVNHPGTSPRPFVEKTARNAEQKLAQNARDALIRSLRKVASG